MIAGTPSGPRTTRPASSLPSRSRTSATRVVAVPCAWAITCAAPATAIPGAPRATCGAGAGRGRRTGDHEPGERRKRKAHLHENLLVARRTWYTARPAPVPRPATASRGRRRFAPSRVSRRGFAASGSCRLVLRPLIRCGAAGGRAGYGRATWPPVRASSSSPSRSTPRARSGRRGPRSATPTARTTSRGPRRGTARRPRATTSSSAGASGSSGTSSVRGPPLSPTRTRSARRPRRRRTCRDGCSGSRTGRSAPRSGTSGRTTCSSS